MSNTDSTMEIKSSKVEFSAEVLNYFENLKTEENSKWIDKYFEYVSYEENLNATKYETHHIIPAFLFSDENHKNRKETEPLADIIYGNKIKLSDKVITKSSGLITGKYHIISKDTSFEDAKKEVINNLSK